MIHNRPLIWRIVRNRGPIGKRYRLQRGYWYLTAWEHRRFSVDYEEEHDTREEARAAQEYWEGRRNGDTATE
jgi:hypothetical protein